MTQRIAAAIEAAGAFCFLLTFFLLGANLN
jgi:hypothetical protein